MFREEEELEELESGESNLAVRGLGEGMGDRSSLMSTGRRCQVEHALISVRVRLIRVFEYGSNIVNKTST